jgi:DNA segregation ATPase FtsK/SpoIIIE, S-DNA-T family
VIRVDQTTDVSVVTGLDACGLPTLVVIDGADVLPAALAEALQTLVERRNPHLHVVAGGRPDGLRSGMHWTVGLRADRTGIVLRPAPTDGDVLRTVLPVRPTDRFPAGRGFLVDRGVPTLVQLAQLR